MIDTASGKTKHVITEHNNWVDYGNGSGGLHAYTFCGWLYRGEMEGAYGYGGWYLNASIPDVCPHCVHRLTCELNDPRACTGCEALRADRALGHPLDRAVPGTTAA